MAKGPFMEFLRGYALQTAANAYKETQIPCPTSKTESMAMLIHSIELSPSLLCDSAPANLDTITLHLSKVSKTSATTILSPDVLAYYRTMTILNAVSNHITIFGEQKQTFDPPILYPHTNLYLGLLSAGLTAVMNATVRIGYTLEKVSREDFISALVE